MKKLFFLIVSLLFANNIFTQGVIHGTVTDANTGEALAGVIITTQYNTKIISNGYGFYSLKYNQKNTIIHFNLLGYKPIILRLNNVLDTIINCSLNPILNNLAEVILSTKKNKVSNLQTGTISINQEKIKAIPSITGTPDVLKSLQLFPGIQTANEGTTNLNVRGGSYDQNLILLDEAPIYNPSHALGFFSAFNAEAIKSVTLYKGNYPAQYGGRLSSVVDVTMKEGNNKKLSTDINIGLASNQITIESPIKKNKASFILSFRNSNISNALYWAAKFFGNATTINVSKDEKIHFYDLNFKVNVLLNKNNKVYFSTYNGYDDYDFKILNNKIYAEWGNKIASIRWNHIFNNDVFTNLTLYYSEYSSINKNNQNTNNYKWIQGIKEFGLKYDFNHYVNGNNTLKYGIAFNKKQFNPGVIQPIDSNSILQPINTQYLNNYEFNIYVSNEQTIHKKLSVQYGLRYTAFVDIGPHNQNAIKDIYENWMDTNIYTPSGKIRNIIHSIEPRFTLRYLLNENSSLKASICYNQQNVHLLSNSTIGLPYDVWVPASKEILPENSLQYLLGYYTDIFNKKFNISIETYYKLFYNILDFKDNANLYLNKAIETQILNGIGKSYGIEFLLEKQTGKLNGWVSYTFGNTKYQIEGINNKNWYSPPFDIRHNFSVVLFYKINTELSLSSTFKYTSGSYVSFPTRSFEFNNTYYPYYESRNSYQLPDYHRLDIAIKFRSKKYAIQKLKKEFSFGIYNVYGQQNTFALFTQSTTGSISIPILDKSSSIGVVPTTNKAYYFYLFGAIPTLSLDIKF